MSTLAGLSRAFNRMTGQLAAQRSELMDAYSQIDERRRFTETVLSGVSAGVIGLDAQGRIELPNRAADELLEHDLLTELGHPLAEAVPEFASLVQEAADTTVNVPYLDAILYLLGISREEVEALDLEHGVVTPSPPV